jgi:hypothetical protein
MSYDGRWANITQNRHACQLSPAPQSGSLYVHVRARKVSLLSLSLIYVSLSVSVSVSVSVYIFPVPVPLPVPFSITRALSLREGTSLASTFIERTRAREREREKCISQRNIEIYTGMPVPSRNSPAWPRPEFGTIDWRFAHYWEVSTYALPSTALFFSCIPPKPKIKCCKLTK